MACSSGCPTPGAHSSWGECMRSKGMKIAYCRSHEGRDKSSQDRWDAELDRYASAVKQGIQPDGTTMDKILAAEKTSEAHGHAYRGDRADYGLPQLAEIQQAATVGSI